MLAFFSAFESNSYSQREVIFLQITHFVIENDGKIASNDAFSFQPKSPLLEDETMCRARAIGIQHANMSLESGTSFYMVYGRFTCVSERF